MTTYAGILLGAGALAAGVALFWFAPRRSGAGAPRVAVALTEERWIRLDAGLEPGIVVVTGGVPVKLRFSLAGTQEPREVSIPAKKIRVAVPPGRTVTVDFLHHEFESVDVFVTRSSAATEGERGIEARGAIVVAPRPSRKPTTD